MIYSKKNNLANIDIKTVLSSFVKNNIKKETLEELKDNLISHHDFFGKGRTGTKFPGGFNA